MYDKIGVISDKELKNLFPDLYREYKNIYGSKRPTISIFASDYYSSGGGASEGDRDIVVFYKDGRTKVFKGSWGGSNAFTSSIDDVSDIDLVPDSAVMQCTTGYNNFCWLYVHPSMINTLLGDNGQSDDLDVLQKVVLYSLVNIKSSYRIDELRRAMKGDYADSNRVIPKEELDTCKDVWKEKYKEEGQDYKDVFIKVAESLEDLGYVKVRSDGAISITNEGKNREARLSK